jgi:hypothetical protein
MRRIELSAGPVEYLDTGGPCPARRGGEVAQEAEHLGASARGQKIGPPSRIGPTGCSRQVKAVKAVAMPKLPQPPEQLGLGVGVLVDPDGLHRRQVDHQPAVDDRVPGDGVPAAADRDRQVA